MRLVSCCKLYFPNINYTEKNKRLKECVFFLVLDFKTPRASFYRNKDAWGVFFTRKKDALGIFFSKDA